MFRRFSANFAVFSMYLDFVLISFSLYLAVEIRPIFSGISIIKIIPIEIVIPWFMYIVFPAVWVGVLLVCSVYDGRKNLRVADEMGSLIIGSGLAAISMAGILYFSYRDVSRFLFLVFILISFILLGMWRALYRLAYRQKILGRMELRRVLILGFGNVGKELGDQISRKTHFGLQLVGYLDDDPAKVVNKSLLLGDLDDVHEIIKLFRVDDVVVTLPRSADQRLNAVVSDLHNLPVRVWVIPDYFALTLHRASVEEFAGIPMLDLKAPALTEYQRISKRAFDLIISVFSLPILSPLLVLIGLVIKLDSRGPVFYLSNRVGENGKLFKMIKFRTMVEDAEQLVPQVQQVDQEGRIVHKTPDDPRVTKFGKFLRKTSLDELPQIFNVIKGDMSLVGPRPEMPYLVEKYATWQRKRFAVPQGVTGWWQVNGRSDKPMHLHTEDDLYYVQHYSIWLDIQILIRTIGAVVRGKGAF